MAELLGEPYRVTRSGEHVADLVKDARLEALHLENVAALQVFLCHGTLAAEAWRRLVEKCDRRFVLGR